MTVPATAQRLDLSPHPEGGWFRRTWTATHAVSTPAGERPAASCIHYLLTADEQSAWHVVSSDEIWMWHGPGDLELRLGGSGEQPVGDDEAEVVVLGRGSQAVAQYVVPAATWQAARPLGSEEVLVSCVVSPGFDFADWRLAAN